MPQVPAVAPNPGRWLPNDGKTVGKRWVNGGTSGIQPGKWDFRVDFSDPGSWVCLKMLG